MNSAKISTFSGPATNDIILQHIRVVKNVENCPIQRENSLNVLKNNLHNPLASNFLTIHEMKQRVAAVKKAAIK